MTDGDLQRAKEIFLKYACNHFHLDREVDAAEYKRFDISNAQENKWMREYISHWISQLSVDDLHAVDCLSDTYAGEALPKMFRLSDLGDSFTKLWYANAIWDIAWGGIMSPIMRERARRKSISLWKSLLENPVEFTDEHRKKVSEIIESQIQLQKSLRLAAESRGLTPRSIISPVGTPEEYILHYANNKLAESKKRVFFQFLLVSLSIVCRMSKFQTTPFQPSNPST
jgi:hypothetical protein